MDHDGDTDEPRPLNAVPFVLAVVVVGLAVVLGYLFLRPDDSGELVRPVRLTELDEHTVRAQADLPTPCHQVRRAQVEMAAEAVFLELVVDEELGDDEGCTAVIQPIEAEITLPDAIEGRELRAGVGRFPLPCEPDRSEGRVRTYRCAPGR